MAAISDQSSYSVQSSTSTKTPFSCMCRGESALSDGWEWFLPITRRGHFFQDSFFENSRSHFDAAIRDVLGRWGDNKMLTDTCHDTANNLSLYRQLRSRDLKEENQAVTVSYDINSHKIVLDVHDFMNGEVKVKVIGDNVVRVEGVAEIKKESEGSSSSLKFSRRFILPEDTNVEAISSVMSLDGILTIIVPKKTSVINQEGPKTHEIKVTLENDSSQSSNSAMKSTEKTCDMTSQGAKKKEANTSERYCENCYKNLQSEKNTSGGCEQRQGIQIPIKINTSLVENQKYSEAQGTQHSDDTQDAFSSQQKRESGISNESQTKTSLGNTDASSYVSTDVKVSSFDKDEASRRIPISMNFHPLPIMRRGLFFNDSIFENARNDFQSAVQEVLSKWGERSSLMDDLSCYRSLRTRDLREENQAVKVNEDERNHKFVLDVHDFMNGGEVNVKAINDRELVVEGQVDTQEGGSKSVKRFFKRFVVPSDIILSSVTSVMSSDGVLTITAPKKLPALEIRDVTSSLRSESIQDTPSQYKQEFTNTQQNATQSSAGAVKIPHESCESAASNVHQLFSSQQGNVTREHIIPVQVEDRANEVKVDHSIQMTKTSSDSEKPQDNIMKNSEPSVREKSAKAESSNTNSRREIDITKNNVVSSKENAQLSNVNQQSLNNDSLSRSCVGRLLPISRKGSFFNDSFFEGSRQCFQRAVRDVLQKCNEDTHTDDITVYRGIRQRSLSYDNLALDVCEDEHCHKVVLDARDFTNGDITVSILGERELLIEGQTENKNDSSASSQRFSQRFLLPDSVDIHSITSAISSDGVLTVESPKRGAASLSNAQKMSSEAHSRHESHNDSGHKWEEKAVKESSEQSEGYSSRSTTNSYRAHQEQCTTNDF